MFCNTESTAFIKLHINEVQCLVLLQDESKNEDKGFSSLCASTADQAY